jgi:excisionase family DNA binding protein
MNEQKLLTKAQIAERAQVTLRTVTNWIADGMLSACKLGGAVRITEEQYADMLQRRTQKAKC